MWRFLYFTVLLVVLSASSSYAEDFLLEVVDERGLPLPVRVRVRDESGVDHWPPQSLQIPLGPDTWFVTPGKAELDVPSGTLELRVEHGLEFLPVKESLTCRTGQLTRHRIVLRRWVNMREQGYMCGENHLHVPIEKLGPQLVAEGLDFGTSLQWWNARRFDVDSAGGAVRTLEYAGIKIPTSIYDYEIEHDWGAVYVVGQPTPLVAEDEPAIPNLPLLKSSHDAGALVSYQGGWSREVLLDALLGHVDVVNICNNNFLRHAYQPRSRYSNLLDVNGFPTYANNAQDMLRMNTETYYRLLNCGLCLAAGAGSATGPKRSPVGYNRTYVRVDENATLSEFLESWRQGRNFVTNGPMLHLSAEEHYFPGDTVELDTDGGTLNIEVATTFPDTILSLELVVNGRVVHTTTEPKSGDTLVVPVTIRENSWLAARCIAEDRLLSDEELSAYAWGSEQMPRKPTRLRFAHTSPIYVSLDGKQTRVPRSIAEAEQMLDAMVHFSEKAASSVIQPTLLDVISEARERLHKN